MKVLHPGKAGQSAVADIVFVHGLRGDPIDTWSTGSVCWPRDLLKSDQEDVRILSWAYDSGIAQLRQSASHTSYFGHAETLLSDLAGQRISREEVLNRTAIQSIYIKLTLVSVIAQLYLLVTV